MGRYEYVRGPEDQRAVFGTFVMLTFVIVWISSFVVPLVSLSSFACGQWQLGGFLAITVGLAYLPWPSSDAARRTLGDGFSGYFRNSTLFYEQPLDLTKKENKVLMCVHPHGIFCMGWGTLFCRPELSGMQFCFSPALFKSPFFRRLCITVGAPQPADKRTFQKLLQQGQPVALIPGGFEEATLTSPYAHRIYGKSRQGYVKYALQAGYALTPVYCFGENKTYSNLQGFWRVRFWLNGLGFPAIVPFGRWSFPLLPRPDQLHIVVGAPLQLPKIPNPTPAQVAEHRDKYLEALSALFDAHKSKYGAADETLEIW